MIRDTSRRLDTVCVERHIHTVEMANADTVVLSPVIIHAKFAMRLR